LGEEQPVALLQESLSVAHKSGALATKDLERVVVDTTVQCSRRRSRVLADT
jgi:IS5 family transposase